MIANPSAASPHHPAPVEGWRWGVVWLLFAATLINYSDRLALNNTQRYLLAEFVPERVAAEPLGVAGGGLAVAAEQDRLSKERNRIYARIQLAFGLSYALFHIAAGFLIDRFSLRWLYVGALLLWSAAGVATGFVPAGAVALLMVCRAVLGVGESFNWPCAVTCIRRVIPRDSRGLANGIFHGGASLGAVATPFLVLMIVDTTTGHGWRTLFVLVGSVGAVWAVVWMVFTRGRRAEVIDRQPPPDPGVRDAGPPPSFGAVLGMRTFWVCFFLGVGINLCWHFYTQWLPRYLTEDLRVSGEDEQLALMGFFIAADLGSMASGWTTRKLIRSGFTVERSRKVVMLGLALVVWATSALVAFLPGYLAPVRFPLFFVVAASAMGGFAIFFSLAQDIAPGHTAKILGVAGCGSWLVVSGMNLLVGELELAGPGKYAELFLAVGSMPMLAAAVGWLWPEPRRTD